LNAPRTIVWLGPLIAVGLLIGLVPPSGAAQDCSRAGIAQTRREFKQAYDKKDFDAADALMTALWNGCFSDVASPRREIDPVLRARLNNDSAILAHRRRDDEGCLQALMGYMPPTKHANPELAKLPPDLQRAINFNYRLCRPYCDTYPGPSPSCESIRATAELEKMVEGGFAERSCPFDTGGSPTVALPDGNCLTVFAAAPWHYAEDDEGDLEHQDPDTVCPRVSLVRMDNGNLALTPLAVPKQSMLRSIDVCCRAIDLAINAGGQIELTPSENPPENCLSGHRWSAQQDIFVLRGEELSLIHGLDYGNR
jgi:hypothetical protein